MGTEELCKELAQHEDLSESIHGTLAVAFHSLGLTNEALEHMSHSLDYHLLTRVLKEKIIVDMVKHTSQQDAKLQDVSAQLKELQETVKALESEVKSGKSESGDEAQRRACQSITRTPHGAWLHCWVNLKRPRGACTSLGALSRAVTGSAGRSCSYHRTGCS